MEDFRRAGAAGGGEESGRMRVGSEEDRTDKGPEGVGVPRGLGS